MIIFNKNKIAFYYYITILVYYNYRGLFTLSEIFTLQHRISRMLMIQRPFIEEQFSARSIFPAAATGASIAFR